MSFTRLRGRAFAAQPSAAVVDVCSPGAIRTATTAERAEFYRAVRTILERDWPLHIERLRPFESARECNRARATKEASAAAATSCAMNLPSSLTLAHLNFDVADLNRSEPFYRDVLGLPVTRRTDSLLVRPTGSILVLAVGAPRTSEAFHFGFRVATDAAVDAWFARLEALHVPIVEHPVDRGSVYVGRLSDPDGYAIEIYAERPD